MKVKCTVVQALRLCTGSTVHRGIRGIGKGNLTFEQALRLCTGCTVLKVNRGIGKGKMHSCTGTEALYRRYCP